MRFLSKFHSTLIFTLFLILALGIYQSNTNHNLFLTINSFHTLLPVKFWELINVISYRKYLILQALLLVITFLWKRDKLLNIIILIMAYFIVFAALKTFFGEARPYIVLDPNSFYWLNMYEDATKNAHQSFPSGHVGNMAVFAFAISSMFFDKTKLLQFLMLLFVLITGVSRICTGWHWPLDVIASGLIGYLLVKICLSIRLGRANSKNKY